MISITRLIVPTSMVLLLGLSLPAFATWSSWEYRDSNGEYRYGIKNGSDKVKLNLKNRKKADKAAKKMNKAEKGVMAGPDGQGDYRPGGELPR